MRISNRKAKPTESLFSSRRIFYVLFTVFIALVIGRFISLQALESNDKNNYLFSFQNIYAKFAIENKQTVLKSSKNVNLSSTQTPIPPYTLVTLHLTDKLKAIYQLIPDKKEHTVTLFTRPAWYEIIGGAIKTRDGASIVRIHKNDSPALLVRNATLNKSLYHAKKVEVIALQKGLFYHSATTAKTPIPYYGDTLKRLRRHDIWNRFKGIVMEKSGVITHGNKIIHIAMGTKNMSLLADKKTKRYNLVKASTINVSITDAKTPSSTLKLVDTDFHLAQTKLAYHFVNLAHLLIKYQIEGAEKTILNNTLHKGLLQKELLEKIDDFKSFGTKSAFETYQEQQKILSSKERETLNHQLMKYVVDGDYYRAKKMILLGANVNVKTPDGRDLLSVVLESQERYIPLPNELKFVDNELIIKGNDSLFNFKSYLTKSHFSTKVPVLDKPLIPQKETLKSEKLNQFVDVTHLNGLYVSDPDAKVYYSKKPNSFLQELNNNYQKSPPLFLYDPTIEGKFVAPNSPTKGRFYYKIVSNQPSVRVAFNGKIKVYRGATLSREYNSITPFINKYTINMRNKSAILEVNFSDKLLPCAVLFSSKEKIDSLRYSFNGKEYQNFNIIDRGDNYLYKLPEGGSKTFKDYHILLKADTPHQIHFFGNNQNYQVSHSLISFDYTPSLSCLAKPKDKNFLSLYDEANMLTLIPKEFVEKGMRPKKVKESIVGKDALASDSNESINHTLNPKLLPIYGDGVRFGLTSKGLTADELTLDANFSNEVAKIFIEVIQPLTTSQEELKRKEHNTILEGASVVLKENKEGKLEVLSMFSYPYPSSLNIEKPEAYKKEIFKYMLLDEFNNKNSLLKNRALDMRIRPGSTFKMVTAIAGFKAGMITQLDRDYRYYIEGRQDLYGARFKNGTGVGVHLKNFSFSNGETERTEGATFKNSFKFSYNVYFGYLALMLNHKLDNGYKKVLYPISSSLKEREEEFSLLKVANDLGFNKAIPLSQTKNIKSAPSNFPSNFVLAKEVADTGIGQFEVAATPMQMAVVANTIRTGSVTFPTVVKNEPSTTIHTGFISPYAQQEIKEAMYQVVNSPDGTAKCAFFHENFYQKALAYNRNIHDPSRRMWVPCMGYRYKFKAINPNAFTLEDVKVYGKTGTAEKGKGKLYDGWFVAFTKSPRGDIIVATVVRNSGTGGTYSATITKRIIESWYSRQEKKQK